MGGESSKFLNLIAKREQMKKSRTPKIYQKSSRSDIYGAQLVFLSSLPNINIVLAERLLQEFKSPMNLFNASKEELQKVHGIGKTLASQIIGLFTQLIED